MATTWYLGAPGGLRRYASSANHTTAPPRCCCQTGAMEDDVTAVRAVPEADRHRRRAAHLYGLIITGAVLATASDSYRIGRVALILLATLAVYWAAESYAHWNAARAHVRRPLNRAEQRMILHDGWPMVAASGVPLLCLALEAVVGVETSVAIKITLAVNSVVLFVTGWQMGRDAGVTGSRLFIDSAIAGLLGLSLIVLKSLLH